MTTVSRDGHDISGTTANRPTNAEPGMTYFDTTLQQLLVLNSAGTWQDVADASNPTINGAAGTTGTGTTAGTAGGAVTLTAGAGGAKTGTGAAAGGAGGAIAETAGNGGNTASSGSNAAGAGGGVTLTAGTGGNATAGTGNGGAGGSVDLVPGPGGTSAGGTAGARGKVKVNGVAGLMQANFVYGEATPLDAAFFIACRNYRVEAIIVRPLVVGSDGGAVTAQIRKAPSGTASASGTVLHSSTADLKGTANTNQSLTLSTTSSDLDIASGDAIAIDVTGVTTDARGVISVLLNPR